ncbi:hypothetical protein ILYODFUR_019711 [Ilyodon furcidens]|uniref:Uncharacterized protein n=1 Tax=Ilyodon furcidens TaxID=33524 RepID=A0ABV0TK68_9TELE
MRVFWIKHMRLNCLQLEHCIPEGKITLFRSPGGSQHIPRPEGIYGPSCSLWDVKRKPPKEGEPSRLDILN